MIKSIIKILLISTLGISILSSIPELITPLLDTIDSVLDTNLLLFLDNVYSVISPDVMLLLTTQTAVLTIIVIIRFVLRGKK